MKTAFKFLTVVLTALVLIANAFAQSPREELQQMVVQLQNTPNDNALREKIIKLAQDAKPAPSMPEEVERRMARGEAAFESARDVSGYENATREFQAAANAAPWYANAYFNLGVVQEKAGKATAAMESFRFYLLAAPDGKDAAEVKKRIYKLEYTAEQAAAQAVAEQVRKNDEKVLIVPGKSAGLISLGMPASQVENILGQPTKVFQKGINNHAQYNYDLGHGWFNVTLDGRRNVCMILVFSSQYRTRLGVTVGSNIDEARRELGHPEADFKYADGTRVFHFSSQGITIETSAAGRIIDIQIYATAGAKCS